jgi:hypothetical protein
MAQIGKAYIEIIADLKKFPADLRAKLKAALKEGLTGVEFTGLEDKAKVAGEHAAENLGRSFERKAKARLAKAGEEGGRGILSGLRKIFSRNSSESGGFLSGLGGFFGGITSTIKDTVQTGVGSVQSAFGSIQSGVGSVISGGGDVLGGLKAGVIAAAIPAAAGLAGALFQLGAALFALPAAAGVGVAAIAPLIIAFEGFGEAVGAGLSGDVGKFNEALKGLPSSMRSVVREVVGLKGLFTGVKTGIQQAFFQPLVGVVGPAIRSLLATVGPGLAKIAGSLGNVGAELLRTFSSPENLRTFTALLDTTNRIVQTLEPTLSNLAQGFLNLIRPALPFLERGATAFRDLAGRFEGFTRRISTDGTLSGWLNRAADIGKKLLSLFKEVGKFVGTILNSLGDEGTDTIRGMADAFKQLNGFLKTDEGKEALHNLGVVAHWAGNIIVFLIGSLIQSFQALNFLFTTVRLLVKGLEIVGGAAVGAGKAIGGFFVGIWRWLVGAGKAIGDFFTKTIPSWWDSAVTFFASLPDRVVSALRGFKDAGEAFLIDAMKSWYQQVFQWVGNVIGIILSLPQLIPAAFDVLKTNIMNSAQAIWDGAVAIFWEGVHEVEAVFLAIPGLLSAAGNAIWSFITDLWQRTVVDAYNNVAAGFEKVIGFFTGLPDRIRAIGPALYTAAVQLGHKIGDGLANIGTFASDVGHKIVDTIKSGINWVIRSINSGIAEIDDKLPGTLPRIPQLAKGAVVDSPTLALVGEAGPEAVIPLNNPRRAQELAEQSGLLGMLSRGARTVVNVVNYLDASGVIIPTVKKVVNDTLDDQGGQLAYARAA